MSFGRYPSKAYETTLKNVQERSSEVRDFLTLFPSARPAITHWSGWAGPQAWTCEVQSRQVNLIATLPLSIDPSTHAVTQLGVMQVVVLRNKKIRNIGDGQLEVTYEDGRELSMDELRRLLQTLTNEQERLDELAKP